MNKQESCRYKRYKLTIKGTVQGVGFRPFIYNLANSLHLGGFVKNTGSGVTTEIEGSKKKLELFIKRLAEEKPEISIIDSIKKESIPIKGTNSFKIMQSTKSKTQDTTILADLALCTDCLREMNAPNNKRYRYPFITCTNCGPRYTIITGLPYDRAQTTMTKFPMCKSCRDEYEDPKNRRFHAQPLACPDCGPHIELWDNSSKTAQAKGEEALQETIKAIKSGKIVAVKGLGGFHLMCDAKNEDTVKLLRKRKNRPKKPFALMFPHIESVEKNCQMGREEKNLITSIHAPIVLLKKKEDIPTSRLIAPDNPYLGAMLPYTPLHHLIMQGLDFPIVATSGNKSGEPICTDNHQALKHLAGIADIFLIHNRPIANRADDSIIRIMAGKPTILRRARGYAPTPIGIKGNFKKPVLAVGGHLKNTIALGIGNKITLSPHIGNLDTPKACEDHKNAVKTLCDIYEIKPHTAIHDKHPDYQSTRILLSNRKKDVQQNENQQKTRTLAVNHHYAHALSCMADNGLSHYDTAFAIVWDGTGYGDDGTIWGGEFLKIGRNTYKRTGHFLPFMLPGGDMAAKDTRRSALGLLYTFKKETAFKYLEHNFPKNETKLIKTALEKNINCPKTSSVGRLFDGISALLGLCQHNSFEGEAAMQVEFAAANRHHNNTASYNFNITKAGIIDWRPILKEILDDLSKNTDKNTICTRFHNTLVNIITKSAINSGEKNILLTGGCFQNKVLLESSVSTLKQKGLTPHWHSTIPANDGGISTGQCMALLKETIKKE